MYPESVIRKTGQWWKVEVGFLMVMAGGILMFIVQWFLDFSKYGYIHLIGVSVGFMGLVFLAVAIRCPKCKAKWFWLAASKRGITNKWGKGVLLLTDCPECNNKIKNT
ncbi:MAG: hypothetical protein JW925_03515 [Syntrophaceae bacterium]|nr:hypothetical protein [Syntrophaceae bacterium]